MMDPATQGEFMLSFVAERHQERVRQQALTGQLAPHKRRWERTMMLTGDVLLAAGAALKARGHLDSQRPAVSASMEVN